MGKQLYLPARLALNVQRLQFTYRLVFQNLSSWKFSGKDRDFQTVKWSTALNWHTSFRILCSNFVWIFIGYWWRNKFMTDLVGIQQIKKLCTTVQKLIKSSYIDTVRPLYKLENLISTFSKNNKYPTLLKPIVFKWPILWNSTCTPRYFCICIQCGPWYRK